MNTVAPFEPPPLLRNAHAQSLLAGARPRNWWVRFRCREFERHSGEKVLDCGDGVRLLGLRTPRPEGHSRGTVVLLHGWEGSARSTYVVSVGHHLWSRGYEIFRLNFRDHGDSHHLNEDVFHSCRLDEVVGAVSEIARQSAPGPLYLVGFSLGGNFALRVALAEPELPLVHVVAVCPAIDPKHVLRALENGPRVYERYFMRKWRRSLRRKQQCFPTRYDFADDLRIDNMRELTWRLIERYTEIPSLDDYLSGYSVAGPRLAGLRAPTTILAAADDPVTPTADLREIAGPDNLRIEVHERGGHCAFLQSLSLRSWMDRRIESLLQG